MFGLIWSFGEAEILTILCVFVQRMTTPLETSFVFVTLVCCTCCCCCCAASASPMRNWAPCVFFSSDRFEGAEGGRAGGQLREQCVCSVEEDHLGSGGHHHHRIVCVRVSRVGPLSSSQVGWNTDWIILSLDRSSSECLGGELAAVSKEQVVKLAATRKEEEDRGAEVRVPKAKKLSQKSDFFLHTWKIIIVCMQGPPPRPVLSPAS